MDRFKMIFIAVYCLVIAFACVYGQHQWTDLGTQYWVNGVDVAIGVWGGQEQAWHRYLIGSDGVEIRPFRWWESGTSWIPWDFALPGANKVISYNSEHYGDYAVCSAFEDDIYLTEDGGQNWDFLDFPDGQNKRFSTVEVKFHTESPGQEIYVGMEDYNNLPTAYIYHIVESQPQWDRLGGDEQNDPMYGLRVYDIECNHPGVLMAGTEDGIFMHVGGSNYSANWERRAFDNQQVVAVEDLADGDSRHIAAVNNGGQRSLWYSSFQSYFDDPIEIRPGDASFDKEVHDLSGVWWGNGNISCYAATSEGVYLIFFDESSISTCESIDLKVLGSTSGYYPMQYDQNCVAVDYIKEDVGENIRAIVLAATPFNVYQIVEVRAENGSLVGDIEISDAVQGTYASNIVSLSFPENPPATQKALTISENGLIKQLDGTNKWIFMAKAFTDESSSRIGTDVATDFTGQDNYILASSRDGSTGTIMRTSDGGIHWTENTPQGDPVINSVDLDPLCDSAYSAGEDEDNVWSSTDNGLNWGSSGDFDDPTFNDIYSDPDPSRDDYVYAAGTGDVKALMYDGQRVFRDGFSGSLLQA